MMDIADLRFFRAIASAPSLAAAARALDVTPPAVSQRLAQLESRLRLKLVDRGARIIRLTHEGKMIAGRAESILNELLELSDDLAKHRGTISGPLTVVAPLGIGRLHVAPLIASLVKLHPEVTPTLLLSEDPRGATRTMSWDVLINVGPLPDIGLTQRKLASNRRLLVASPSYLKANGAPSAPEDLRRHKCGVVREDSADVTLWNLLAMPSGPEISMRIDPAFASNDGEVVRAWAMSGMGIIERSEWSVYNDIRQNRLTQVLPDWQMPDADIVALVNPRAVRAARIEAFIEHLVTSFSSDREFWPRAGG